MPRRKQDRPKRMKWEDPSGKGTEEEPTDSNSRGSDVYSSDSNSRAASTSPPPLDTQRAPDERLLEGPMLSEVSVALDPPPPAGPPLLPSTPTSRGSAESPSAIASPPTSVTAMTPLLNQDSGHVTEEQPLDFSVHSKQKRRRKRCPDDGGVHGGCEGESATEEDSGDDAEGSVAADGDAPLDLSVPRKRSADSRKSQRAPGPWGTSSTGGPAPFPFRFMTSVSPSSSVELPLWNGHHHGHHHQQQQQQQQQQQKACSSPHSSSHSPATTPVHFASCHRHTPTPPNPPSRPPSCTPSHSTTPTPPDVPSKRDSAESMHGGPKRGSSSSPSNAWQSHWLSRGGAHQAKEVLTCVWCRRSFRSLEELTVHMKEARHCGVGSGGTPGCKRPSSSSSAVDDHHSTTTTGGCGVGGSSSSVKDSVSLPRKLVRGQDVWLGKGAEQTKQILKCMWCGQSFKSLAEMTTHMQQTQHYTNIISQEQIISWKSPEDKTSPQAHVNAVLTCKVCDQAFSSLKELSNHMVKNAHYKEHILRSITESGGRRRAAARERRKKALPVRKLLELERAQQGLVSPRSLLDGAGVPDGKVTCEKCTQRIDAAAFVEHIRQCLGIQASKAIVPPDGNHHHHHHHHHHQRHHGSKSNGSSSSSKVHGRSSAKHEGNRLLVEAACSSSSSAITSSSSSSKKKSLLSGSLRVVSNDNEPQGPSVLNAIERLIEKSFEYKRGKSVYTASAAATAAAQGLKKGSQEDLRPLKSKSDASDVSGVEDNDAGVPETPVKAEQPSPVEQDDGDADEEPEEEDVQDTKGSSRKKSKKKERTSPAAGGGVDADATVSMTPPPPVVAAPAPGPPATHSPLVMSRPASVASADDGQRSPALDLCTGGTNSSGGGGRGMSLVCTTTTGPTSPASTDHPLRELQKLLDKTNVSLSSSSSKTPTTCTVSMAGGVSSGSSVGGSGQETGGGAGAILAFSWACSDAVMTDSVMKCAFCDTPFVSKGAYRHHLSKMHFIKDGQPVESSSAVTMVSTTTGTTASSTTCTTSVSGTTSPPAAQVVSSSSSSSSSTCSKSPPKTPVDESPHSKFLKYTELAKQLSSKYV